jgi:hypothetical protein
VHQLCGRAPCRQQLRGKVAFDVARNTDYLGPAAAAAAAQQEQHRYQLARHRIARPMRAHAHRRPSIVRRFDSDIIQNR